MGAAKVLREGTFDAAGLYDAAKTLLGSGETLASMSAAMKRSGVADAAERIADLVLDYVK